MPHENTEEGRWFVENLLPHEAMLRAWLQSRFRTGVVVNDIIQEAYLKVCEARRKGPVNAPKAFLFATAHNLALNAARHARVRNEHIVEHSDPCEVLDEDPGVRERVARYEELEILTRAIQSLPDRCRQIFTLRKVYGMSQQDIARQLNLSARTVNAQLAIGINKCAEYVGRFRQEGKA
jgi:RNA polymerase sigma factor (sigma-70 family)